MVSHLVSQEKLVDIESGTPCPSNSVESLNRLAVPTLLR